MKKQKTIHTLYRKLINLYPENFKSQLGESMKQTFSDLCNEKRRQAKHKWFGFVLWTFVETAIGIVREHALLIKEINPMKNILTNLRSSTIISFLLLIPFMILEWATRSDAPRTNASMMLWVILWLLSTMFLVILIPIVRNVRAGNILMANSVSLLPRVFFLVVLAWMWVALIIDQMPCFLGGSGC